MHHFHEYLYCWRPNELTCSNKLHRISGHFFNRKSSVGSSQIAILDLLQESQPDLGLCKTAITRLQLKVADASLYLPTYDQRSCTLQLKELSDKLSELEPKRSKFSFKRKEVKAVQNKQQQETIVLEETTNHSYLVTGSHQMINVESKETDVTLKDVDHCIVWIQAVELTSLFIKNVKNSIIITGPIAGSLFCEHVQDCCIASQCRQLRIHHSIRTHFYVSLVSTGIIEDCQALTFGPHPSGSALPKIEDFNWQKRTPSPNFQLVDQAPSEWPRHNQTDLLVSLHSMIDTLNE